MQQPTHRPRAFGRTSNVWQYVETVHERLTPPLSQSQSQSRESASPGDQLRRPTLDCTEEEEDEEDDDLRGRANGQQLRRSYKGTGDDGEQPQQLRTRKVPKSSRSKRASKSGLKAVSSLPELLHPPLDVAVGRGGALAVGAATAKKSLNSSSGTGAAPGSPSGRRAGNGSGFSATEILKRLQALGTSASAPFLPSASDAPLGTPGAAVGQAPGGVGAGPFASQAGPSTGGVAGPAAFFPGALTPTPGGAPLSAGQQPPAVLSDAEKLRNDFSSQQSSKLYFGCSVAFELFNGHLMMVGSPDGHVRVQSLEKLQAPQVRGCRDRAIFTMIDLTDVRSANTICYGDAVWLQLSVGAGDVSWEQGGVLGAKVREAPQLKALALSGDDSVRNSSPAPAVVGHPVPVKAYLPKSREDGDTQADEIQARVRNKGSKMLGKWIIRSAVMGSRKHKDGLNYVYNNDEVYLEQDWFYLGADSDAGTAVLRQLPPSTALKDVKDGEYLIERRAAWRIRLLDSTNGGSGLSLAQQQMERLLFRAKMQLKQSKKMRAGQTKAYAPDLRGGSGFSSQLRSKIAASTAECDQRHMERQDRRLDRLAAHLTAKAETMNRRSTFEDADGDFAFPSDFCLRDASDPNSARSQGPSGGAQRAVGQAAPSRAEYSPAKPRVPAAAEVTASPERGAHVCALCQSSTIAYNLCSQTESVMHAITSENELATSERLHSQRSELKSGGAGGAVQSTSQSLPVGAAGDITVESSHSSGSYATEAESTSGSLPPALSSRRKSRVRDAAPAVVAPSAPQQQQQLRHLDERERILRLFSLQDAHMLDLIRFKERTAQEALVAEEHARMGLSPAASHFRDRFKHVGLLAHAHRESIVEPHGIGGHFHKLHAELQSSSGGHQLDAHVERLAQELGSPAVELDKRTCPVEFPVGEGIDAYGNPVDRDAPDPVARLHVFPTADELELIAPVDTKAVMELYSQNRAAVAEMLDGFTELCETQMVPNLRRAVERGNRGSLVEILEFTARAAEFVSARRLQVRVAWLLHEIAGSDVGAFDAFRGSFDALLAEVDGTLAFIRFYREKGTSKRKKERA